MWDEMFVLTLAVGSFFLLRWATRTLPGEGWQIIASVPGVKEHSDSWNGSNLTYYGLFVAGSLVAGTALIFVLGGSAGVPKAMIATVLIVLGVVCVPASRIVARVVEKKKHTFTIGGASFLGILIAPGAVWLTNHTLGLYIKYEAPSIVVLSALALGYAFGEGLGRLACISFGCCYGRPLAECSPWVRRFLGKHVIVFTGKTKKIAYESGLDGTHVVPIQAMTSALHIAVCLVGTYLYLKGFYCTSLILVMTVTQVWRALSETLRADYRGEGDLSAYQVMAIMAALYVLAGAWLSAPVPLPGADLVAGLSVLWDPILIIALQSVFICAFLVTGRSSVTGSTISFHVIKDKI
jgi:prolipoprotein diacylglyceryltransferase